MDMDRKKLLKEEYKEIKTEAGIYQIRNIHNQKVYVDSTRNLKTLNGKVFMLKTGTSFIAKMQKDLTEFGSEAFVLEVLEVLEKKEDAYFDEKDALKKLKAKWLDKLQPFGERGYN